MPEDVVPRGGGDLAHPAVGQPVLGVVQQRLVNRGLVTGSLSLGKVQVAGVVLIADSLLLQICEELRVQSMLPTSAGRADIPGLVD